ncbi:hypothetical protein HanIR_Chr12g0594261 [Helianthus annuus]|nr:hypothetical protein HanIR_Chr12g0594261 [Helianthus annuus]
MIPKAACVEESLISGLNNEQYRQFLSMFGKKGLSQTPLTDSFAGKVNREDKWIVDSGASEHITHRKEWLDNQAKASNEMPVAIPNGSLIPVEGNGTCILPNGLKIKNVLHVPKFTCNLLSVSR